MGVKSFLGKCLMIASTSSLIRLTQWRADWTWWRTRSSSLCRLDGAISSRLWGPMYHDSISTNYHLFWQWEVHRRGLQSSIHRKAIVGKTPVCQLENHQFHFANRSHFGGSFLQHMGYGGSVCVHYRRLSLSWCLWCTHLRPPWFLSFGWHLNFNFRYLWGVLCAHRSSIDGQEPPVLVQPLLPLSCRAWSRWPMFPNSKFPHLERGTTVV